MSALVLGAGLVSGPVYEYLHKHSIPFTVVSCLERELVNIKGNYPQVTCYCMDIKDHRLPPLISQHTLVINILPPDLLTQVAEMCLEQKRHMLCASYVTPELWNLHQRALKDGILLLCECGLDPGLDHMLAMQVIDKVAMEYLQVVSFTSWCGGLPAPECSNNPLQYKFSWNPKGALLASQREAGFLKDGELRVVAASEVLDAVCPVDVNDMVPDVLLEGHPNTFSPHHLHAYGLQNIRNFFRGTLRYKGFSLAIKSLMQVGLFSQEDIACLQPQSPDITWRSLVKLLVTTGDVADTGDLEAQLLARLDNNSQGVATLERLGLLSEKLVEKKGTPLDALAAHLTGTLAYGPQERDMIVMRHDIEVQTADGSTISHRVTLVVYGQPGGHSAMAQTVGYPIAIVARMILDGEMRKSGVVIPTTPDIYQPVLSELAKMGIEATSSLLPSAD